MRTGRLLAVAGAMAAGVGLLGYWIGTARAVGIPAADTLTYSGVLHEDGAPADGERSIQVVLWDDAAASERENTACSTPAGAVPVVAGAFEVPLGEACTEAVRAHADLWAEVVVEGDSLGRSKLGAVPYAVEAERATKAAGALADRIDSVAAYAVPVGAVLSYAGEVPPPGWLICDGSPVSREQYAALFAAIGTTHGEGDGATTFNLPDHRGRFLRGVDGGSGRDPDANGRAAAAEGGNAGDAVGSVQDDAVQRHSHVDEGHTHGGRTALAGAHSHTSRLKLRGGGDQAPNDVAIDGSSATPYYDCTEMPDCGQAGEHTHEFTTAEGRAVLGGPAAVGGDPARSAAETRPQNAAVMWIIKY